MNKLKTTLGKKYGPLPLWAWTLLTVVVLYAGLAYMRSRNANASNTTSGIGAPNATATQPDGGGGGGSLSLPDSLPNTVVATNDPTPFQTTDTPQDPSQVVQPLDSAPLTSFATVAPGTIIDPSGSGNIFTGGAPGGVATGDPEHNAYITGKSDVDPFNVTSSAPPPDALDRYLANQQQITTDSTPPPPAPITQKILPAPVPSKSPDKAS